MPRRPHLILLVLVGLVLTGCGSDLSGKDRAACSALVAALPHRLAGQAMTQHSADGATWGDPAITLTCGVGRPDGFEPTSTCTVVRGVGWFVPPDQVGTRPVDVTATTVDRRPRVQVHVPKSYWPSTAALVDLATDVRSQLTRTDACS